MDEFGVLVQGYGIKAQGKSAPMAASKTATTKNTHTYTSVNVDQSFGAKPFSNGSISGSGSFFNDQNDDVFGFNSRSNRPNNYASSDLFDDVFQVPKTNSGSPSVGGGGGFGFDVESMFKGSMNLNSKPSDVDDDLIWGFSGKGSSNVVVEGDDLLSSDPVDDFFGKLGNSGSNRRGSEDLRSDDLIPGFGRSNTSNDSVERAQAVFGEKNSGSSTLEELEDFVTGGTKKTAKGHVNGTSVKKEEKNGSSNVVVGIDDYLSSDPVDDFFGKLEKSGSDQTGSKGTISDDLIPGFGRSNATNDRAQATSTEKISGSSSLEELEDFVIGGTKKIAKGHVVKKDKAEEANFIDIEGTLNGHSVHNGKVKNASEQMFQEEAPDLDSFFPAYVKKSVPVNEGTFNKRNTTEVPNLFSETAFRMEKKVSPRDFPDDFSSIFGVAPTSEVFEEVEGESDDRRRARLGRHKKAMARMEQALAELNQREYQAQQEQEERHRIAEVMEVDMKRWAAGKEGNLRALLSSLQQVLAPELGWQPVTLTDLITSSQVKLAYKKAALCVHPDKVQQKGASLQQKYVAEKAFDLLKEAWNKFSTEELR